MEIFLKSSFHAGGAHGGVEGIALVLQFVILLFADGADIAQQMGRCGGFILAGGGQADISAQIIPVFDQGNQINVHVFSQDIG